MTRSETDRLSPTELREARGWVLDCTWGEEPEELEALSASAIECGIDRHYPGGLAAFRTECCEGLS